MRMCEPKSLDFLTFPLSREALGQEPAQTPTPATVPGFSQIISSAAGICLQKSCRSRLPAPIRLQWQRLLKDDNGAELTGQRGNGLFGLGEKQLSALGPKLA